MNRSYCSVVLAACLASPLAAVCIASDAGTTITALKLKAEDVLATGNEWLALPEIRASDGALMSFNVLSMRDRGLLQVTGEADRPVLEPHSGPLARPWPCTPPTGNCLNIGFLKLAKVKMALN